MNLRTVIALLSGMVESSEVDLERDVVAGAAADLMSDVLAFARPDCVLLTGLTHPQVVRTAEIAGIRPLCLCAASTRRRRRSGWLRRSASRCCLQVSRCTRPAGCSTRQACRPRWQ